MLTNAINSDGVWFGCIEDVVYAKKEIVKEVGVEVNNETKLKKTF